MPNPTTKLASFLFKGRRLSQASLELSSSRECLAAGKVRERGERREKIKAKLKNKTLFTKAIKETYKVFSKNLKFTTDPPLYYKT